MANSDKKDVNIRFSFPLLSVVFVVFLVLKLCNVIAWSWWWVTAPLWMPITLLIAFGGLAILGYFLYLCFSSGSKKKKSW